MMPKRCTSLHSRATIRSAPLGSADGQIGRVAVLRDWRGMNVGDALMRAVIAEAERRGLTEQTLTAQVHATAFYERLGFKVVSDEFLEAGIPHVEIRRSQ